MTLFPLFRWRDSWSVEGLARMSDLCGKFSIKGCGRIKEVFRPFDDPVNEWRGAGCSGLGRRVEGRTDSIQSIRVPWSKVMNLKIFCLNKQQQYIATHAIVTHVILTLFHREFTWKNPRELLHLKWTSSKLYLYFNEISREIQTRLVSREFHLRQKRLCIYTFLCI